MKNSLNEKEPTGGQMTLFSSVGSHDHASLTPQQESEKAQKMTVTSGRKCLEQFERFNRAGLWAKTFAALLIGTGDWYSTKCNLTWKLRATKCCRFYFHLVQRTHSRKDTGFGLLPTPTATDFIRTRFKPSSTLKTNFGLTKNSLNCWLLRNVGTFQTPTLTEEIMGFPTGWTNLDLNNSEIQWTHS